MKVTFLIFPILAFVFSTINANSQGAGKLIPFASGLTSIVAIAHAGDSRLFVVNQRGSVSIVNSAGTVSPQTFLDIRDRVVYGGERGLLGVAFHPQYKTNGYFYVNYVGSGDITHISRFKVNAINPDLADPESELKLLSVPQPFQNHNGGDLKFGPDGYLYIGLGDGGSGGDPDNRAQNPKEFLGKMLRIDVDHGNPYTVPATNPFANSTTTLGEIWALGLRNPWRFSFDRLNGDLWIADVGQNVYEEIDFQPANSAGGENYGWRCYEGDQVFSNNTCNTNEILTFPVYTYSHDVGCSVTGGYIYRGTESSPYYGYYFFSDYCTDWIWTLHQEDGRWIKEDFGHFSGNNFSTFGEDVNGQLYVAGIESGKIFKIDDQSTGIADLAELNEIRVIQLPNSHKIRVETNPATHSVMHINVFDISGIRHFQTKTQEPSVEFDLSFLPSGTYFISTLIDGKKHVHKLILTN